MEQSLGFSQDDLDRFILFEHTRKTCETAYAIDPLDADNLTKWGGSLLELSQFQSVAESKNMINDAISKLEEALAINPTKHDALWCLGNGHTSVGFLTPNLGEAQPHFNIAEDCFKKAYEQDPTNELYLKSLEVTSKAAELHVEIHRNGSLGQQQTSSSGSETKANNKGSKSKKSSNLKYDILGWVILAVGIVAWVGMAKSNMPPPPPSR